MPAKTIVIRNPRSAAGRTESLWKKIEPLVREHFGPCEVWATERAGHGKDLGARAAASGAERVLVMGGDGTFSEVLDGLASEHATVAVGLLPSGTGGDFSRMLCAGGDWSAYLERISADAGRPLDVGQVRFQNRGVVHERHFVNVASFGVGGLVDRTVERLPKRFGGKAAFSLAAFWALLRFEAPSIRVSLDGAPFFEGRASNLVVANGRFFGGGMMAAPGADPGDGIFRVCVLPERSLFQSLSAVASMYDGSYLDAPDVLVADGKEVEVRVLARDAWMDIDGESPEGEVLSVKVVPSAFTLLGYAHDA